MADNKERMAAKSSGAGREICKTLSEAPRVGPISFLGSYAEPLGQVSGFKFRFFSPVVSMTTSKFLKFCFTGEESEAELGQR